MIVLYDILEVIQAVHFDHPDPRLGELIARLQREIRHAAAVEKEMTMVIDRIDRDREAQSRDASPDHR